MPIYTDVFGGANIYPSEISYSSIALSVDVTLSWPEETSTNTNLATRIIDVTPATSGLSVILPAANKTGTGNTILFNNRIKRPENARRGTPRTSTQGKALDDLLAPHARQPGASSRIAKLCRLTRLRPADNPISAVVK